MSGVAARLERLELLARVIEAGTAVLPWCGNVALQKLVYLLQKVFGFELGYQYGLHHYGPYSPELADDIALGEAAGRWRSWAESFTRADGVAAAGKHFEVLSDCPFPKTVIQASDRRWLQIRDGVERACRSLKGLQSQQLELVATLHYLRHVQEVADGQLAEVLMALKPKFTENEVAWGLDKLGDIERTAGS